MAILKEIASKAKYIKSVVDYVKKDAKTAGGYYVDGINCDPNKATAEFVRVQQLWEKTDGRRYFHYVMSWNVKDNITPELALEIAKEWISKTAKLAGHQILLAAHLDQKNGNIHVHIVGNSVNIETGVKLHRNAAELAEWKKKCNEINLAHGFQLPREKTRAEKRKNPTTWTKEEYQALERAHKKQKKGLKEIIMESVIDAYSQATSRVEFMSHLAAHGIETIWKDTKKNITFTATDKIESDTNKRTVRDSNLEKTFGIKCDKDTLETRFQTNLEQQIKEKEALDAERKREAAELLRITAEFERRKSGVSRRERQSEEPTSVERTRDTAAFIAELDAKEQSATADRADRDAARERQAAEAERRRTEAAAERERLLEKQRKETAERIAAAERRVAAKSNNNSPAKKKNRGHGIGE